MKLEESECNKLWTYWKKELSLASSEIKELAVSSEEGFISLGDNLYNISNKAKNISEISLSVADFLVGEKTTNLIKELKSKLNNIDEYFQSSLNGLSEDAKILEEIQNKFVQIEEPFKQFKKIINHLNILSISIRIKSASLNTDNNQFNALAEDIITLTNNAEIKIKSLLLSVESSNRLIQKLFTQLDELKNETYLNTRAKLGPIQTILDDYKENQRKFADISQQISTGMIDNSEKVNSIVTSLQFHDIARQKLEHVMDELNILHTDGTFEIASLDENENIFYEKSKHIDTICRIQNQQLEQAKTEITVSVGDVHNRLMDIKGNISNSADLTNGMVNSIAESNEVILEETEHGIEEITDSLFKTVDANITISDTIMLILNTVEEMIESATDINNIGANIQMMAFNGLIHASQIGDEGASLGVIADAIQQLSTDSQNQIVVLKDLLKSIEKAAEEIKLNKTNESGDEGITNVVKDIANELKDFFNRLKYINTKLIDKVSDFNSISNNFTEEIGIIVTGFTIGDTFTKSINNPMQHLNNIIEQSEDLLGSNDIDYQNEYFDELKNKYTMDSEREILDEYINTSEEEITQTPESKNKSKKEIVIENDDNVELF